MQPNRCDSAYLDRFFDQELGPDEDAWMATHVKHCPFCQKTIREHESISALIKTGLDKELAHVNLDQLEERVLMRIQRKQVPLQGQLRDLITSKKFYVPLTAAVAALVLILVFVGHPRPGPVPSAIVSSLGGDVASVMILETPKSHQTILWITENGLPGGESSRNQQNQGTGFSVGYETLFEIA